MERAKHGEAPIKSNGDAASTMPESVLLNRICAMQMHQAESLREPLNSALISGSLDLCCCTWPFWLKSIYLY